jgi:maleate cis-trans isomerase
LAATPADPAATPTTHATTPDPEPINLGFLYPGLGVAEDDLPWLIDDLLPASMVEAHIAETPIDEDAHTVEALAELGQQWRLRAGAAGLPADRMAVVLWACTSGSFVFGLEGARRQAADLANAVGVPCSSTSLAFVNALNAIALERVAIAATYPEPVTSCFARLLTEAHFDVVSSTSNEIMTAAGAGALQPPAVKALVRAADHPRAEVILVPDTALHTVRLIPGLEAALGKTVLTANQVTVWEALRLAGVSPGRVPSTALFTVGPG